MSTNKSAFIALDPAQFSTVVRQYALAKADKKEAEAKARAFDKVVKADRQILSTAMEGYVAATCGHAVLTIKESAPKEGAITLKDGRRILLTDVSYFMVGKERVAMSDVKTLYGGAAGSEDIDVVGEP